jgi:transcription-repair coupling factor (superfamily II helicase)
MLYTPLHPPMPSPKDHQLEWGGLLGSSQSLSVCALAQNSESPVILIADDVQSAQKMAREIEFFKAPDLPLILFEDRETLPYDVFSPYADLISERLLALYRLKNLKKGIVITALPTILHRLLPHEFLFTNTFALHVNDTFDREAFRHNLVNAGYRAVDQVMEHGEFAVRGAIIDVFPMGNPTPYRIELFDDQIETLRCFDPETQRSLEKIQSIQLLPAREYPLTENAISLFRQNWRETFSGNPMDASIYANISEGKPAPGVEYYLPFFFEKTETFFDYMNEKSQLVFSNTIATHATVFWNEVQTRYEQLRYDIRRPLCEPQTLFLKPDEFFALAKPFLHIRMKSEKLAEKEGHSNFKSEPLPDLTVNAKAKEPYGPLAHFIRNSQARILFCAESAGRKENLLEIFYQHQIRPKLFSSWIEFLNSSEHFGITISGIERGLWIDSEIALVTETQLFGERVLQRRTKSRRELDPDLLIKNLTELNIGSPVVHVDHGIGRYLGLQTIKTGDIEGEYLTLEYAAGDKIYVPVSDLHRISRYTGADSEHAPISRLGSKSWQKTKEKVAEKLRDVAAELLDIYSKREASSGFSYAAPSEDFIKFRAAFPFEETKDQTDAINAVISDMLGSKPMDRLVCGDVGFGKTEVAMQAAFLAVQNHKQVAILVPTTLLATQHAQNFSDRFADWPIKIDYVSRMKNPKETDEILKALGNGKIDIIIGTHKLLSESIRFKDLGLLIVDEEHRFGVRHKDRIKALRANVDILTLTATPIPRTLNMAMTGVRDLSLITTPPARRLAIKTFVHEFDYSLIREAMVREIMRGGQVYFLHNEVSTIEATAEKLQALIPQTRIITAHGQMPERQLERVMSDFYHQKYNVLMCTTIIESGIDIPSANTIIINRADKFGLAQLHQLRGRVGRSHHQAYAYLLTPPPNALTKDAEKRLDAIAQLEDLGAGFYLATHDLEIRGAGEILGEEQSGQMQSIGFNLYMDMLQAAIEALKKGESLDKLTKPKPSTEIDLRISAMIPEDFIHDVNIRLTFYKRLADCRNEDEISELKSEIIDRFGLLPASAENLLSITKMKLISEKLGIRKIDVGTQYGRLHFNEKPNVDPSKIIHLIQQKSKQYQLADASTLRFTINHENPSEKIKTVFDTLSILSAA